MFSSGFGNNGDFEGMARQYWSAWGEAMRQAGAGGAPAPPANQWQQAVDWWSKLMPGGHSQANDAVGRFNQQASQWFGQMQQVAAQFAGQDSSAADISQAWRRAIGAAGDNPFPEMFKAMRGQGAHGLDQWLEQVKPYLEGFQQQGQRWQQMPAFGQYREHQERWQALQKAQQDYQLQTEEFNTLMAQCAKRAFEVFEDKLTAREEPGRQITTARGLFDLWIDSAEEAYAAIALSQEFREVYGALGNAQMRLRAAIQLEVEHLTGLFGMPTRTEVDSAHRKIAELERALRRAAAAGTRPVAERRAATSVAEGATPSSPRARPRRGPRKQAAVRKARAPTPAPAKVLPAKKAAARKVAAKPAMVTQKTPARKAAAPARRKLAAATKPAMKPATKVTVFRDSSPSVAASRALPKGAAQRKSAPAQTPAPVVSMKDWVARYAPTPLPGSPAGKGARSKGARK